VRKPHRANRNRHRRRRQGRGRPLTAPLRPKDVRREVRSSANQRFGGVEHELGRDIRASRQRQRQVGDWYGNYLRSVAAGQQAVQNAYAQANQQTQDLINTSSARDTANTQRLQAEEAKSAAVRGAPTSTAAAQRESAAQAQRNYLSSAYAGKVGAMGANQFAYAQQQRNMGKRQSIEARQEEKRRRGTLKEKRRDLRRERGEYAVTRRGELRDKERDYLIQRRAFPEARAERALKERENAQDQKNWEAEQGRAWWEAKHGGDGGGKGGRTQAQRRSDRRAQKNANISARNLYEAVPKKPGVDMPWPKFTQLIIQEGAEPWAAERAVAKLKKQLRRAAHRGNRGLPETTKTPYAP